MVNFGAIVACQMACMTATRNAVNLALKEEKRRKESNNKQ